MTDIKQRVELLRADLLAKASRLTQKDRVTIEQYCNEYELYLNSLHDSNEFENKHGQVAPAISVRNQALKNMIALEKILPPVKETTRDQYRQPKNF